MLRLQEILQEKNITSKDLAKLSNISQVTISNILTKKSSPKVDTLLIFSKVLNVPISSFFNSEQSTKIQLIINDELKTFYSMEELKDFINNQ